MNNKQGLTKQQQQAIKHTETPLLISAGPGSGKTRTIIEKIVDLVNNKNIDANKILVTTFTNKATEELKNRLREKLGDKVESMQISTIHSFCQKMLETFPEYTPFGIGFQVLDDLSQFIYVSRHYWGFGLKDYWKEVDIIKLVDLYNKLTENDVDPDELIEFSKKENYSDLEMAIAKSYKFYLATMLDPNNPYLDFALIQKEFYYLLKNNDLILQKVRKLFDYILIDEYQDTNPIQARIIELISSPGFNITAVGDEDQSIYGFRGASVENFRNFLTDFPGSKMIKLEENFRSSKEIVEAYEKLIKGHRSFDKKIISVFGKFQKPILLNSNSWEGEGKQIVDFIKKIKKENGVKYGDIALLFRSVRNHSSEIVKSLNESGIPFEIIGDSSLLFQKEITDILGLMAYINSIKEEDLERSLITKKLIDSDLLNFNKKSVDIFKEVFGTEILENDLDISKIKDKIPKEEYTTLLNLKNLKVSQSRNHLSPLKLFYKTLDCTNFHQRLFDKFYKKKEETAKLVLMNLAKLTKILWTFEEVGGIKNFEGVLRYIKKIPENKIEDSANLEELNAVKLMTVHQAKGLEFPVVIMPGVTKRRYNQLREIQDIIKIPKELMLNKKEFDPLEESRRVFYVGMSRAKRLLAISTVEKPHVKKSTFIKEIGELNFINALPKNSITIKEHYEEKKERPVLSYSAVNAFIDCGFRFYLTYVLDFITPKIPSQIYGQIVHNCLKKIHLMLKEREEITLKKIVEIADYYCKDDDSRDRFRNGLITDLWNYFEHSSKFIKEVIDVELPFSYIDSEIIVEGKADLIIKNHEEELEIVDFKAREKKGLDDLHVDIQLRMYHMALEEKYDEEIKALSAYTFKDNYQKKYTNSNEDLNKIKKMLINMNKAIEKDKFDRKWGSKFCNSSRGKCPFFDLCKGLENGR